MKVHKMNEQQKAELIGAIISQLKFTAREQKKPFNEGDTFFSLVFKSDKDLRNIAKLSGI
jgi:hypothetical protein